MPQPHATSFYSEVYNAIKNWAPDGRANVGHTGRYATALNLLRNVAQPQMRVLDVASFGTIVPVLRWVLGFRDITVTGLPMDGVEPHGKLQLPATPDGETFACAYDRFDIEGPFTYADETFDVVILTEVLEHLTRDPMHTIGELNRITRAGGWLLLSTPNCCSLRSVLKALRGQHPYIWCPYSKHAHRDRHNREYTPDEVRAVLECAGYEVVKLMTRDESYGPRKLGTLQSQMACQSRGRARQPHGRTIRRSDSARRIHFRPGTQDRTHERPLSRLSVLLAHAAWATFDPRFDSVGVLAAQSGRCRTCGSAAFLAHPASFILTFWSSPRHAVFPHEHLCDQGLLIRRGHAHETIF